MLDRAHRTIPIQRAKGRVRVGFTHKSSTTRLENLHQSGCLKALLPKVYNSSPEIVLVNTAGGITGGDQLDISCSIGPRAEALATTQTAERLYRSIGDKAHLNVHLKIDHNARFCWLPQETIVFDGARLSRRMNVEVAPSGSALLLESFMLGRKAMGETVRQCDLSDQWRVYLGDKLVFAEAMKIRDVDRLCKGAALMHHLAFATFALVEKDAQHKLNGLNSLLAGLDIRAAASAWDDVLIARFVAPDAFTLRRALTAVLEQFNNQPLPRVWQL
ncbi:urease accessory protein UreD [Maritalea mediterranea]|uniref:Urease accessory protein UreD n=1 Tax=Maritalea mediterranea TaxID=2909667 RepID=A0ABS9E5H8_9HYPH|nr:urease accessory protein UreD [Maritalea mediterranea]MCF4097169.1 urease accessory protein UreD [Maritalea mediterranea]